MNQPAENKQSKTDIEKIIDRFLSVRNLSESLCQPLETEDYGLQAMAETSPVKWHIAHTSWFFETFLLKPFLPGYKTVNAKYEVIFNSYYNGVGPQHPRTQRSLLSRPTVEEVYSYRGQVTGAICDLLSDTRRCTDEVIQKILLGCHHEQQHQELFFTDLKYCWFQNPLYPEYQENNFTANKTEVEEGSLWSDIHEGLYKVGHTRKNDVLDFCFDNEEPLHRQYLQDVSISNHLVTNGEFLEFIEDNGYNRSELWLSDAWMHLGKPGVTQNPLYWVKEGNQWFEYTLSGLKPLNHSLPVSHVSAYEADAFARWKNCRLPTEFELEVFSKQECQEVDGQFLESKIYHPQENSQRVKMGVLWQWTSSAYSPYPGFETAKGAIGEYNGKFMCNQLVLRGGSCVTSKNHYRHSYRNFFYPVDQWQFSGIRLAKHGK